MQPPHVLKATQILLPDVETEKRAKAIASEKFGHFWSHLVQRTRGQVAALQQQLQCGRGREARRVVASDVLHLHGNIHEAR